MLQSSGKVTRKRVRSSSKLSNQKSDSQQTSIAVHTASDAANYHHPQATSSNSGTSPANKSGDSPATLPAEVERIFEVNE